MKEKILINAQFAIIFSSPLASPEKLYAELNNKMKDVFDSTPVILPVPNELQLLDVPIVQMNSKTGVYSAHISRGRGDLFIAGSGVEVFNEKKDEFIEKSKVFFNYFSSETSIKRIAFITRFFIIEPKPNNVISNLLNSTFKSLHDIDGADANQDVIDSSIRYVSSIQVGSFKVNNFTTLEEFNARISGIPGSQKGILITRDFNTNPNENYSEEFHAEAITSFIEDTSKLFKVDEIEQLLWSIE